MGLRKAPPHSLAITGNTHNMDKEKSSGQANPVQYLNNLICTAP